jgi:large subunit ribosomal protein L2
VAAGEQRLINLKCRATIGAVSNPQNKNRVLGKAGASRNLGRRPKVISSRLAYYTS